MDNNVADTPKTLNVYEILKDLQENNVEAYARVLKDLVLDQKQKIQKLKNYLIILSSGTVIVTALLIYVMWGM